MSRVRSLAKRLLVPQLSGNHNCEPEALFISVSEAELHKMKAGQTQNRETGVKIAASYYNASGVTVTVSGLYIFTLKVKSQWQQDIQGFSIATCRAMSATKDIYRF